MAGHTHDLIVIVPDGAIEQVVTNLLEQRASQLGIARIRHEVKKDIFHDGSSEAATVELLRGYIRTHRYALVIRDLEGSGWENDGAGALEAAFRNRIHANGWPDRIEVIALVPEIEAWLRFDSAVFLNLIEQLARRKRPAKASEVSRIVVEATQANGGVIDNKPKRPKEVFESVLAEYGIPRSNSLYGRLAKQEILSGCTVGSFSKFKQILKNWFPSNSV